MKFAAAHLEHPHIYQQVKGLVAAGAQLKWVYDPDQTKAEALVGKYPGAKKARSFDEILADAEIPLVAAAAIPCERGSIGCQVMQAGKDYFTAKAPFTSLDQLAEARRTAASTGHKYFVFYSERVHSEAAIFAGDLIQQGAIGKVVQVLGLGPHRLKAATRPSWFSNGKNTAGFFAISAATSAISFCIIPERRTRS